jgi:3-oxosteroid 1-dehydrogenase
MAEFDETFDWVVIGSGAGSTSSSLLMREAGRSVVILEKSKFAGGTTAKSGGVMWLPNNPFMEPGEDSTEKGIEYLDALIGDGPDRPGTSHEKRLAYIVEGRKMMEFLVRKGVKLARGSKFWPDYYDEYPGGCKTSRTVIAKPFNKNELGDWAPKLRKGFLEVPALLDDGMKLPIMTTGQKLKFFGKVGSKVVWGKLTGKSWTTAGAALQGRMLQQVLKAGADIRLETGADDLIVENGKVAGVIASGPDGKQTRIAARLGVLVNAGGFGQNQDMRDQYLPGTRAEWSETPECDMGDLHKIMERHGAVLGQMDQMVGFQMTRAPGWDEDYVSPGAQAVTAKPHAILVDQSGVRYQNEGGSYEEYCENMVVRNRTVAAIPSWAILDRQYMELYPLAGGGQGKIPQKWRDSGYLKEAGTIEGLAEQIGVDPATLKATVERWNTMVDKGVDEDFHRGEREYDAFLGDPRREGVYRSIGKIEKAPFYAVDVVPGDVSTYGGAVTDVNSRVLDKDGKPIEGLYACGVSTASPMGKVYPGAGASVGPSMTFGWIAAKHAAGLGNQDI